MSGQFRTTLAMFSIQEERAEEEGGGEQPLNYDEFIISRRLSMMIMMVVIMERVPTTTNSSHPYYQLARSNIHLIPHDFNPWKLLICRLMKVTVTFVPKEEKTNIRMERMLLELDLSMPASKVNLFFFSGCRGDFFWLTLELSTYFCAGGKITEQKSWCRGGGYPAVQVSLSQVLKISMNLMIIAL